MRPLVERPKVTLIALEDLHPTDPATDSASENPPRHLCPGGSRGRIIRLLLRGASLYSSSVIHVRLFLAVVLPNRPSFASLSFSRIVQSKRIASYLQSPHTADTFVSSVDVSQRSKLCLRLQPSSIARSGYVAGTTIIITSFINPDVCPSLTATNCEYDQFVSHTSKQRQRPLDGHCFYR